MALVVGDLFSTVSSSHCMGNQNESKSTTTTNAGTAAGLTCAEGIAPSPSLNPSPSPSFFSSYISSQRGVITLPLSEKEARTEYSVLQVIADNSRSSSSNSNSNSNSGMVSVVAAYPTTGRYHQIRK